MEHATKAADILAMSDSPELRVKGRRNPMDQDRRSLQAAVLITLAIGYTLGKKYPAYKILCVGYLTNITYREAHSSLSLALEVGPEPVPIYKAIAKVYLAQKNEEKALESLDTALQLQITYGNDDDVQIAEISREMGNIIAIVDIGAKIEIGRLCLANGDSAASLEHYTRAHTRYMNVAPESFEAADCGLQIGAALAKSGMKSFIRYIIQY